MIWVGPNSRPNIQIFEDSPWSLNVGWSWPSNIQSRSKPLQLPQSLFSWLDLVPSFRQPSANGDWLSQWEMAIFGPLQNRHPLTDRQKSKMAAAAIFKNRKIAISRRRLELSPRNLARWHSSTLLTITFWKSGPSSCTLWLVYALDVSCSYSETFFSVQNGKRAYLNLAIKQQIYM